MKKFVALDRLGYAHFGYTLSEARAKALRANETY